MSYKKPSTGDKLVVFRLFQDAIWEQFLPIKLQIDTNAVGNTYQDYGQHQHTLSFESWSKEGNEGKERLDRHPPGTIGSKTIGLWYENGHLELHHKRQMCQASEKHLAFLLEIRNSLVLAFPKDVKCIFKYMRTGLIRGAKTWEHTDTCRGPSPNFLLVEPPREHSDLEPFLLKIRQWPNFHCCFVEYENHLYIPLSADRKGIQLIGVGPDGAPQYYLCDCPEKFYKTVKPFGKFDGFLVLGIKQKRLQVCSSELMLVTTLSELETKSLEEVFENAARNPDRVPTKLFRYIGKVDKDGETKWERFFGWRNAHSIVAGTDFLSGRIHVFFRWIREHPSASNFTTSSKTGEAINYTRIH